MVAGIGCRAGISGEQVEAAIAAALAALHVAAAAASGTPGLAALNSPAARDSAARDSAPSTPMAAQGERLTAIATPAEKAHEPGIQAAAVARGVPLLAISQPDLEAANPTTVTRSTHSLAARNVHSVAEAAALAGAATLAKATTTAPGPASPTPRLLQPRVAVGPVTCALADATPP